jgi:hypothetical protein
MSLFRRPRPKIRESLSRQSTVTRESPVTWSLIHRSSDARDTHQLSSTDAMLARHGNNRLRIPRLSPADHLAIHASACNRGGCANEPGHAATTEDSPFRIARSYAARRLARAAVGSTEPGDASRKRIKGDKDKGVDGSSAAATGCWICDTKGGSEGGGSVLGLRVNKLAARFCRAALAALLSANRSLRVGLRTSTRYACQILHAQRVSHGGLDFPPPAYLGF